MQSQGGAVMLIKKNKKIKTIVGHFNLEAGPHNIFDRNVIRLLDEISKEILKNNRYKKFPDLISFGFWCRSSNIMKIVNNYSFLKNRVGRGTVLHITPSNIPTNFAYSMVFGLLSGNNNIIRLPHKNFHQVKILSDLLKRLAKKKLFRKSFSRLLLIKYENSDLISSELSKNVEARIIWGGDYTVNKFKSFETKPRCIDLAFADRFSISLVDSNKLNLLKPKDLSILVRNFYNDTYTMDQFGCSSPNSIFWLGQNKNAKKKFWLELSKLVNKVYDLDLSAANKKISNLMNFTLNKNIKFKTNIQNFNLITLKSRELDFNNFDNINFGTFLEIDLKNINYLKKYTSDKLQTITYYGVDFEYIKNFIIKNKIKGIDRVVPIGRAFDITPEWDGIDIISTLSRTIGK